MKLIRAITAAPIYLPILFHTYSSFIRDSGRDRVGVTLMI